MYEKRNKIIDSESIHDLILESIDNFIYDLVMCHIEPEGLLTDKDIEEILEFYNNNLVKEKINNEEISNLEPEDVVNYLKNRIILENDDKTKDLPEDVITEFEKAIFLRIIDTYWMEHINTLSILREGIHLRGYANENPLRAYTNEGFELFENLLINIDKQVTTLIVNASVNKNTERKQVAKPIENIDNSKIAKKKPKKTIKVGRNESCPCGSGKKYKTCCGK